MTVSAPDVPFASGARSTVAICRMTRRTTPRHPARADRRAQAPAGERALDHGVVARDRVAAAVAEDRVATVEPPSAPTRTELTTGSAVSTPPTMR